MLTIDTFFQRILRAFIKELGIDLNYNVEIETASVLSKGADTLIEQITVDRDLQRWLTEFVQERIDEGRKWDVRDGILSLGGELFKEKNKDALSVPRPREELGRIVSRATAQAEATKKAVAGNRRKGRRNYLPGRAYGRRLLGQEPQFRQLVLLGGRGRAETLRRDGGQNGRRARGLGRQRVARAGAGPPSCSPCCARCATSTTPTARTGTPATCCAKTTAVSPCCRTSTNGCSSCATSRTRCSSRKPNTSSPEFIGHNDAPFIYEKVGNRFERFMIDEFQDTSPEGVGKLPAPAAKRHGAVRGDLGADRGRHQAVDLPLAGRRLEDPPRQGPAGAGRGRHRSRGAARELAEPPRGGGLQQPYHRTDRRRGQPRAE